MVCEITHSVIPSFSMPNRSIGTQELEDYLIQIEQGASKYSAGKIFDNLAVSENYSASLDKSITKYFTRAKAFFPYAGDSHKNGISWIESFITKSKNPITDFNHFCLKNQVNCIFCNRFTILDYRKKLEGKQIPHKIIPARNVNNLLNSS